MPGRLAAALVGLALAGAATPPEARAADAGATVSGHVVAGLEGLRLADVAPVVVYLEPGDVRAFRAPRPAKAVVRQSGAEFDPPFLAVARGQAVEMPNDDTIFHNVFSFSAPNAFDLGLYPSGRAPKVRFDHAGPVRLYCSIHENMSALIFVAPTPWFAIPGADGGFAIEGVPPGRWNLRTWSEKLPTTTRSVEVGATAAAGLELRLVGDAGVAQAEPSRSRHQAVKAASGSGRANR